MVFYSMSRWINQHSFAEEKQTVFRCNGSAVENALNTGKTVTTDPTLSRAGKVEIFQFQKAGKRYIEGFFGEVKHSYEPMVAVKKISVHWRLAYLKPFHDGSSMILFPCVRRILLVTSSADIGMAR